MSRSITIVFLLLTIGATAQKKKDLWSAVKQYQSTFSSTDAVKLEDELSVMYNRKFLFFPNPPKKLLKEVERYYSSSQDYILDNCSPDLSDEYMFWEELSSNYNLVNSFDIDTTLIDSIYRSLLVSYPDPGIPDVDKGIVTNVIRMKKTAVHLEEAENKFERRSNNEYFTKVVKAIEEVLQLQYEFNNLENKRLNQLICYFERRAYENCKKEKDQLLRTTESQYNSLKASFAKYQ